MLLCCCKLSILVTTLTTRDKTNIYGLNEMRLAKINYYKYCKNCVQVFFVMKNALKKIEAQVKKWFSFRKEVYLPLDHSS